MKLIPKSIETMQALVANHGLNRTDFAKQAGIGEVTLYRLVHGGKIQTRTAYRIANELGKQVTDLFKPAN